MSIRVRFGRSHSPDAVSDQPTGLDPPPAIRLQLLLNPFPPRIS